MLRESVLVFLPDSKECIRRECIIYLSVGTVSNGREWFENQRIEESKECVKRECVLPDAKECVKRERIFYLSVGSVSIGREKVKV